MFTRLRYFLEGLKPGVVVTIYKHVVAGTASSVGVVAAAAWVSVITATAWVGVVTATAWVGDVRWSLLLSFGILFLLTIFHKRHLLRNKSVDDEKSKYQITLYFPLSTEHFPNQKKIEKITIQLDPRSGVSLDLYDLQPVGDMTDINCADTVLCYQKYNILSNVVLNIRNEEQNTTVVL